MGGIILGLIELLGAYFVGAGWSQAIVFAVFLLALNFRPQGLFGGAASEKA
jgi:branched-chain amino acid transport system permease protein